MWVGDEEVVSLVPELHIKYSRDSLLRSACEEVIQLIERKTEGENHD